MAEDKDGGGGGVGVGVSGGVSVSSTSFNSSADTSQFTPDSDSEDDDDVFVGDAAAERLLFEHGGNEAYELQERPTGADGLDDLDGSYNDGDDGDQGRADASTSRRRHRGSTSTVASFQLYTPDEEQAVVRKFDRRLVLFVALLYLLSFLDRSSTYHLIP